MSCKENKISVLVLSVLMVFLVSFCHLTSLTYTDGNFLKYTDGVVTRFCCDYGMINDQIYFTNDDVVGREPLSIGQKVSVVYEEDKTSGGWKAIKVRPDIFTLQFVFGLFGVFMHIGDFRGVFSAMFKDIKYSAGNLPKRHVFSVTLGRIFCLYACRFVYTLHIPRMDVRELQHFI